MPPAAGGPPVFTLQGRRMRREGSRLIDDFDTLAGGVVTLLDAVRYVVDSLGLPLAEALRMATSTPARLLGLEGRIGALAPGARADLVHLDDDLDLAGVWIGGRRE
jgi:N-acetylglucosamine-6-phosphate deacetylase